MTMNPRTLALLAATSLSALACVPGQAQAASTAPALQPLRDQGPVDSHQIITITVRLKLPAADTFKKTVDALYDPASPTFHQWLTDADLKRFAPPPAQLAAVRQELEGNGLSIVSIDRNGFSIRARGTAGDVARAFNTEIHQFDRGGQSFRANIGTARLSGAAAAYVDSVAGLESHTVRPMLSRAINLGTKQPYAAVPVSALDTARGLGSLITDQSLSPTQTFTYTTPGQPLPTATYSGILYDENAALIPDFTSKQLEHAYGLSKAYAQGLDGTGETVVLLEGYGYPTIEADANTFSRLNGLPALDNKNFKIIYPEGKPVDPNAGILTGWNIEIALDVQWAHSIAPGAKIVVVATNGQDSEDFQASMQYIIDNKIGYAVSDSWEEDTDLIAGPAEQESFENVLVVAAAKGVSFQFSTGDSGDGGLGTPLGAPGVPSSAPHGTAVGGTSILNVVGGTGFQPVGWGDDEAVLDANGPLDPPFAGFIFGGGGGESVFWPKPVWQAALPGVGRQTPDVSALGDPYTGVPIVVTSGHQQYIEPGWGGTSLSSPIFTAFWAIADQKAGHPLGLAGPTIAGLTTGLTDVLPLSNPNNVSGSVTDANGTTDYSTKKLFKGLIPDKETFTAALWNEPQYSEALGFAFGLDSSLTVTVGWDNATGYGTPDGLAFIDAAAAFGAK